MVRVSMTLYWKFIRQRNIINAINESPVFRINTENHYYSFRQIKVGRHRMNVFDILKNALVRNQLPVNLLVYYASFRFGILKLKVL